MLLNSSRFFLSSVDYANQCRRVDDLRSTGNASMWFSRWDLFTRRRLSVPAAWVERVESPCENQLLARHIAHMTTVSGIPCEKWEKQKTKRKVWAHGGIETLGSSKMFDERGKFIFNIVKEKKHCSACFSVFALCEVGGWWWMAHRERCKWEIPLWIYYLLRRNASTSVKPTCKLSTWRVTGQRQWQCSMCRSYPVFVAWSLTINLHRTWVFNFNLIKIYSKNISLRYGKMGWESRIMCKQFSCWLEFQMENEFHS